MLILFGGPNGQGKTLNAIKFVNEDSQFQHRPIYYHGINDLKLPWIELDEAQVKDWWSLPDGSVLFVDEAYKFFPKRPNGSKTPVYIERIAEHRSRGIDIVTIWQSPHDQMDTFLRGLVGQHIQLERKFNTQFVNWYEWAKYEPKPLEYFPKQAAITRRVKLDKKYFDAYTSAALHTHKTRLPWKKLSLAAAGLSIFIVGGVMAYDAIGRMKAKTETVAAVDAPAVGSPNPAAGAQARASSRDRAPMTSEEYQDSYVPRIADFPHTAPRYDELTVPVVAPKLAACVYFHERDICSCATQQATPLTVSKELCMQIVDSGWFDDTSNPEEASTRQFGTNKRERRGRGRSTSDSDPHLTSL